MRNLASRLGVVPMALYKHVTNKEDLLDGMVDTVVAGYERAAACAGWKSAVREQILAARRALQAHPWLRPVIETRTSRTPIVLAYMDSLAGILIGGGLSVDLTHHAMHALGHRIWGFSPEAFASQDPSSLPDDPAEREAVIRAAAQAYPHIAAIATDAAEHSASGACDEQFEFEFTLDLLLDAFERLHETGWSSRSGRGAPHPGDR